MLYADYIIFINEIIEVLRNKFRQWKEAFESNGLKADLGKNNVMVSGALQRMTYLKASITYVRSA